MNKQMEHERNNTNISRHTYIYMHTYIHTHKHTRMPACSHTWTSCRRQLGTKQSVSTLLMPPRRRQLGANMFMPTSLCAQAISLLGMLCHLFHRSSSHRRRATKNHTACMLSTCECVCIYIRITIQTGAYVCIFICNHEAILQVLLRKLKRQNNKNTSNWIMQHK